MLDAGPEGTIFFSITDFDKITKSKGEIVGDIEKAKIKLNIIVFKVKSDDIKKIVNCCLEKGGIYPGANRFT